MSPPCGRLPCVIAFLSRLRRRAARCFAVFCTCPACSSSVPFWPCLRIAWPPRLTNTFMGLALVGGFSVEGAGHAPDAAVSSRNLLQLERRHIDRKFLELTFVGEELV